MKALRLLRLFDVSKYNKLIFINQNMAMAKELNSFYNFLDNFRNLFLIG